MFFWHWQCNGNSMINAACSTESKFGIYMKWYFAFWLCHPVCPSIHILIVFVTTVAPCNVDFAEYCFKRWMFWVCYTHIRNVSDLLGSLKVRTWKVLLHELQVVHWRFAALPFFSQLLERSACVAIYIYIYIANRLNVRLHCVAMQTAAWPNPNVTQICIHDQNIF